MARDEGEIRRRVRAARELATPTAAEVGRRVETRDPKRQGDLEAGLSIAELANRLIAAGYEGLKKDTLDAINRGVRTVRRQELAAIARVCGLPYSFFTIDFEELPDEIPVADDSDPLVTQVRMLMRGDEFREALRETLVDLGPDVLRRALAEIDEGDRIDPLEQDARAASRQLTGAAADRLDSYAQDDAAAAETRGEADATPAADLTHPVRKRSGA